MDELKNIRLQRHNEYLSLRRKEELLIKIASLLEFDKFERARSILSWFFKRYYKDKYKDAKLISLSHTTINSIKGFDLKHIKNKTKNIVFDLNEFDYIKDMIPKRSHKKCLVELKKVRNIIYSQDFDYRKGIFSDTKFGIGLNNPMIEKLYNSDK
jgi:hypothetical protein